MRVFLIVGVSCLLVSCATTSNINKPERAATLPLNSEEIAYISHTESDGRLMYEKDIRSANASDLLLSKISPSDYPDLVGWVTYPNDDDYTVSFYEKTDNGFSVLADVIFSKQTEPVVDLAPARNVAENEISMIRARIVALENGISSCTERYNTVVLPSQNDELWDVYVLAATTDPKLVQVGGHVKVTVSKSNAEIVEVLPLSSSCLALDKTEGLPEGATVFALSVSHLVTPMPVVIHPYINLLHNIKLVVSSERGLWMIDSGKIEPL